MASEFEVKIDFDDNSPAFRKALKEAEERILYAWGVKAVEGAVNEITDGANEAVDTGRLRASISFITPMVASGQTQAQTPKAGANADKVNKNKLRKGDVLSGKAPENSVIIGSNVNYAQFVHNGTRLGTDSEMPARPFLRAGIDKEKEAMKEQTLGILQGKY